jgi:restriction system protein
MSIPDFQSIMLPLLQYLKDQKERSNQEIHSHIAKLFNLTEEDLNQLLPSGTQKLFNNRVAWAKSHLKQALLISSPQRGNSIITERGLNVLKSNPDKITIKYLNQFAEFVEFRHKKSTTNDTQLLETADISTDDKTPEEYMEYGYQSIIDDLSKTLLKKIKECPPGFFEKLVIDLLLAMGYGGSRQEAGKVVGKSGDGGIDGIINEDKLGLDSIYIQAKRWEGTVGRPEIQRFVGALHGKRAKKGIFITTSFFTKEAHEYVSLIENKIVLIDGENLTKLMIDHNVGVTKQMVYEIKRIDTDYFIDE